MMILNIWGILAGVYGIAVMVASKSAIHEIEAGLGLLIATVSIGCAAIIQELKKGKTNSTVPAVEGAITSSKPKPEFHNPFNES